MVAIPALSSKATLEELIAAYNRLAAVVGAGVPGGAAGGVLSGTYPNPGMAAGAAAANIGAGGVTTAMLAADAAQAVLGGYSNSPAFSTTTVSAWLITPVVSPSLACGGGVIRLDAKITLSHTAGGIMYVGAGIDGVFQGSTWDAVQIPAAGHVTAEFSVMFGSTTAAIAAGNHTFSIWVYNGAAGTLSISNAGSVLSYLYVTEIKR